MNENGDVPAWLAAVLASAGTGLAGLVTILLSGFREAVRDLIYAVRQRITLGAVTPVQLVEQHAEFQSILTSAKAIPNVERILVFIGHNAGGLPREGCRYTVRCVAGWTVKGTDPSLPVRQFQFDLDIDTTYAEMLNRVNTKGWSDEVTAKMEPGSLLRGIYEADGVMVSIVHKIHHEKRRNLFVYCSAASYAREFTDSERSQIAVLASRLRAFVGGKH